MTKKRVDIETGVVSFDFENGENFDASLSSFDEGMIRKLALHGLSQKLGDSYASAKQATEGTERTVAQYAKDRVETVFAELVKGEWTVRSGGSGATVTDLAKALAEATDSALEDCVTRLAEADKDTKKALRAHPAVKAVLDRIRAERAAERAAKTNAAAGEADSSLLDSFVA